MTYESFNDSELVYLVKENEEVLSLMIHKYEPLFKKLAFSFVQNHKYKGLDVDDLIQQCRITMCYALDRYDNSNETKFYSYLIVCLNRAIRNYARSYLKKPDVYTVDDDYSLENVSLNDYLLDGMLENDILNYIKNFSLDLNFFETCVFELRFNNFSYKEISTLLEVNVKKIDNTLLKIRKKLQKFLEKAY